jgi:hypothetical protein
LLDQKIRECKRSFANLGITFVSVWAPRVVANISDVLVGEMGMDLPKNGETANAGVENTNHRWGA